MTTSDLLSNFVDHLSAAAHGAAAESIHAMADDALKRGVLDISPEAIIGHISVSDCTSRLLATQRARVYDKVRRSGSDLVSSVAAEATRLGLPTPAVHLRLRHSASLLAGHGPDAWTHLMHALQAAAVDAGVATVTGPLVAWRLLPVCDVAPHVLEATPRVLFRADLGHEPDPDDIRGLALALLSTRNAAPAVLSAGAASCPAMDPERVDVHSRTVMPGLSTQRPAVVRATAHTLSENGEYLSRLICGDRPQWRAGAANLEVQPAQFSTLPSDAALCWVHAGWPLTRPESNRLLPGAPFSPQDLADRIARLLSPVAHPGARYAVVDMT